MAVARTKQDDNGDDDGDGDDDYDDEWRILLPFYALRLSLANFNSCFALHSLPSPSPSLSLLLALSLPCVPPAVGEFYIFSMKITIDSAAQHCESHARHVDAVQPLNMISDKTPNMFNTTPSRQRQMWQAAGQREARRGVNHYSETPAASATPAADLWLREGE